MTFAGAIQSRDFRFRAAASVVFLLAAIATLTFIRGMSGTMPMPGGWEMSMMWAMPGSSIWGAAAMFLAMWLAMMIAMMLPSSLPMLSLYYQTAVSTSEDWPELCTAVAGAGYFTAWIGLGAVVFALGFVFSAAAMQSAELSRAAPALGGLGLILAGFYQLSYLKQACLTHCRSPLMFLGETWKPGIAAAARVGFSHGLYCIACCWALMAIQAILGVMNLGVMIAVAAAIAIEKLWARGPMVARVTGVAAIAFGIWIVYRWYAARGFVGI